MDDESGKPGVSANLPSGPAVLNQQLTVETETVPSVPTLNVAPAAAGPRVRRSQDSVPRQSQPSRAATKRRSQRLAQGSKADIFAAKVAHAVTEQEQSENEETFVYDTQQPAESLRRPYARTKSSASLPRRTRRTAADDDTYDTENESQADSEAPQSPPAPARSFLVPTPRPSLASLGDDDDERERAHWLRQLQPPPRGRRGPAAPSPLRDANDSVRAKHSYLQRWKSANPSATDENFSDDVDETSSLLKHHPHILDYKARSLRSTHTRREAADAPFDSDASSVGAYYRSPPSTRLCVCGAIALVFLLSVAFVVGFIVATLRPLQDFDVLSMSDVLVSDRELVFSLIMHARNPSIFATTIYKCDLDVFATSSHVAAFAAHDPGANGANSELEFDAQAGKSHTRTLLLGSVAEFDSPVEFGGGIANSMQWRTGAAKLVDPLKTNATLWSEIITYDFELDIKGVLSYSVLGRAYSVPVSTSYKVVAAALL